MFWFDISFFGMFCGRFVWSKASITMFNFWNYNSIFITRGIFPFGLSQIWIYKFFFFFAINWIDFASNDLIIWNLSNTAYVYISESFSTNIKSFASLFIICYGSIISSVCNKIYPDLCSLMGIYNVYYLLVFGCILSGIGTYFFVPETKGKSLHEIQKFLREY